MAGAGVEALSFAKIPGSFVVKSNDTVPMTRESHQFERLDPVNTPRGSVVSVKHSRLLRSVSW